MQVDGTIKTKKDPKKWYADIRAYGHPQESPIIKRFSVDPTVSPH